MRLDTSRLLSRLALCTALLASPAEAEVEGTPSADGFVVSGAVETSAPADAAWTTLLDIGNWWSSAHSWSGDAHNMTLEARAGGCWCERLAEGGSVLHGLVVAVHPRQSLLLRAELGPLQMMPVNGSLQWTITPNDGGGSRIRYRYRIWGHVAGDPAALAAGVDAVLAEQAQRLATRLAAR